MSNTHDVRERRAILLACTVGNFVSITPAVTVVLSLFLIPIAEEFDWPRARVSGVIAVLSLIGAIVVPIAGRLADRYGARRVILIGHAGFALSFGLFALASNSLLGFYLIFAVIGLFGAVPLQPLFSKVIAEWFDANRALCLAISGGVGNAIGAIVMPVAAGVMLAHFGWRHAWVGIGMIVFAVGFPTLYFLLQDAKPRMEVAGWDDALAVRVPGLSLAEALRTRVFWLILTALVLGAGCLTAVFTHIAPLLTDRGFSSALTTAALSTAGLACAGWQILVGFLLDRVRTARVLVPMFVAGICGVLILQYAHAPVAIIVGGALVGIGLGTEFGALPYLLSRYFGLRAYGSIVGAVFGVIMFVQGIVPFLFDASFDHTGSYRQAVQVIAVALAAGAVLLILLPPYSRTGKTSKVSPSSGSLAGPRADAA